MSAQPTPRPARRRIVLAAVLAVLVLTGVAGWLVARPSGDAASPPAAAPTTAPASTPAPGSYGTSVLVPSTGGTAPADVPTTVLADVPGKPEALAPVALDQPTGYADGTSARLVDIKAVTAQAHGAGETSGPALAVIVELTNTTDEAMSLDTVAVNMYLGTEGSPAARVQSESGNPFSGSLEPGATAQAVYAFTVPVDRRDLVTVTVGRAPESGTAVFAGAVA